MDIEESEKALNDTYKAYWDKKKEHKVIEEALWEAHIHAKKAYNRVYRPYHDIRNRS